MMAATVFVIVAIAGATAANVSAASHARRCVRMPPFERPVANSARAIDRMGPGDVGNNRPREADVVDALFLRTGLVAAVSPRAFEGVRIRHDEVLAIGNPIEPTDPPHLFGALTTPVEREDECSVRCIRHVQGVLTLTTLVHERERLSRGPGGVRRSGGDALRVHGSRRCVGNKRGDVQQAKRRH